MPKKQTTFRIEKWIVEAVKKLALEKSTDDDKWNAPRMINHLLEKELNYLGYTRAKYEAKQLGMEMPEEAEKRIKNDTIPKSFKDVIGVGVRKKSEVI